MVGVVLQAMKEFDLGAIWTDRVSLGRLRIDDTRLTLNTWSAGLYGEHAVDSCNERARMMDVEWEGECVCIVV